MNRAIAEAKKQLIEAEITLGRFDPSLARYQDETYRCKKAKTIGVHNLWVKYIEYKTPELSPKTVTDTFIPIGRLLENAPQGLEKPLEVRSYLLGVQIFNCAIAVCNTIAKSPYSQR